MTPSSLISPPRRRAAVITAAGAVVTAVLAATALAIPPGGPGENRSGATVTVSPKLVVPGGTITLSGSGFAPNQALSIKLDDGLVLPTTPAAGGADVFLAFTADASGNIPAGTEVDLDDVRAADQPAMQDGSHRVRVLSPTPARSLHVDFAVTALPLGPPEVPTGSGPAPPPPPSSGFVAPPESQLLEFPNAADPDLPYSDIPRLVAGSVVPFRFHDFPVAQLVTLKRNDGANEAQVMPDASGDGAGYVAADTSQPGTSWIRFLTGPAPANRSIRAPYAVVPNTDGRDVKVTRHVLAGGFVAYATKALTRQPVDYVPNPPSGQTFRAQIEDEAPVTETAGPDGVATGTLPVPAGLTPGTYTALFTIGFAKQNDFPQAVFARTFDVVASLPGAAATIDPASALAGAAVSYDLASFAANAGGGQKVAVHVEGVADPVACVTTDVAGDAQGGFVVPALPPGARTVSFVAGSECVTGGAVTQPPARTLTQTLTVAAAPGQQVPPPPPPPPPGVTPTITKKRIMIRSTALRVGRKGTITLLLRPASERVKTTIVVRTQNPVKLTRRSKKSRVVTIARRTFTSAPGVATRKVTLTLSKDGRALMRRLKSVRVRVRVLPAGGAVVSKSTKLAR